MRFHRLRHLALGLVAAILVLPGLLVAAPATSAQEACFPETGQCVQEPFLTYWRTHGGLAIHGYPLSTASPEQLEDGKTYTVQYFERSRFEHHPENAGTQFEVLLGQFGRRMLQSVYATAWREDRVTYEQLIAPVPGEGPHYFPQTGHTIAPRFRAYWEQNGGLAQFGYPLTEEFSEMRSYTERYQVQYFERARFEWHPEHEGTPYEILLGQFGRDILAQHALLEGSFGALYRTSDSVRAALGTPTGRQVASQGATQAFERGRMYWAEEGGSYGGKTIYVLCGGEDAGMVLSQRPNGRFFPDTWVEGQEAGGGPAPVAGLYYPQRGFGKIWRENAEVRECLGYARTAEETGFPIIVQDFGGGVMLLSDTAEGRSIYALKLRYRCRGCGPEGSYARYAAPAR